MVTQGDSGGRVGGGIQGCVTTDVIHKEKSVGGGQLVNGNIT